jgi:hypothetical protein
MNMTVADPQRLTVHDSTVRAVVNYVTSRGLDPHEFATSFVNRTATLGYPPNIMMCLKEFLKEKVAA